MKDLSFLILKNSFGAKMKKGFRNFCNGDGSTSTLTQTQNPEPTKVDMNVVEPSALHQGPTTLEEMILQLELEEEMARKAKARVGLGPQPGRMSFVTNSDILRGAHHALSQYPRFSLDGKDSMYRSSFRNSGPTHEVIRPGRRSVHGDYDLGRRLVRDEKLSQKMARARFGLPQTLAGESIVWCKPGVVAKLMGLEAIPVPARKSGATNPYKDRNSSFVSSMKRQNLRRRGERHGMERRLSVDRHRNCSCESVDLRFMP